MKKIYFLLVLSFPMMLLAQVPSPAPSPAAVVPPAQAPDWMLSLISHYPKLAVVIFIVGGLRLTLKPLFSFLHQFLPAWGLASWDQEVTAVESSKVMTAIYFVIDYLGSVKVPVKEAGDPAVANVKLS